MIMYNLLSLTFPGYQKFSLHLTPLSPQFLLPLSFREKIRPDARNSVAVRI